MMWHSEAATSLSPWDRIRLDMSSSSPEINVSSNDPVSLSSDVRAMKLEVAMALAGPTYAEPILLGARDLWTHVPSAGERHGPPTAPIPASDSRRAIAVCSHVAGTSQSPST